MLKFSYIQACILHPVVGSQCERFTKFEACYFTRYHAIELSNTPAPSGGATPVPDSSAPVRDVYQLIVHFTFRLFVNFISPCKGFIRLSTFRTSNKIGD
jgi:hypothetical protein